MDNSIYGITLNWKDVESTSKCVVALQRCENISKIFVIDNESDGLLKTLPELYPKCHLIELIENRGFAAGINAGLREIFKETNFEIPEFVLVINNDATIDQSALNLLLKTLERDQKAALVGPMLKTPQVGFERLISSAHSISRTLKVRSSTSNSNIDFLSWACVLLRTESMQKVGLLDERYFMYWEDAEYGIRLKNANWKMYLVPEAVVEHQRGGSHSIAGFSRINFYSSLGLLTLARDLGKSRYLWATLRVYARIFRAFFKCRMTEARILRQVFRTAKRQHSPIYEILSGLVID